MEIDPAGMPHLALYKLLTGSVVPRPIAWVTTISESGVVNAAPFSAFAIVSVLPPMLLVNSARKNGELNHTSRNIEQNSFFVVNIANESLLEKMHATSAELPPTVSETTANNIEVAPSRFGPAPRIAMAPISMECRLHKMFELGAARSQCLIGEVVMFHVADSLYKDGKVDQRLLRPIGRIGGPTYARMGEFIKMMPLSQE